MIEVQITNEEDVMNIILAQQGGRWDTDTRTLRCSEHSHSIGLTISGTKANSDPNDQQMLMTVNLQGCCQRFIDEVLESQRNIWNFKVESLMQEPDGISLVIRYLNGPGRKPQSKLLCSEHGQAVEVRVREDAIRLRGCCQPALVRKMEQIGMIMRKIDDLDKRQNYKNN
jgi:hypothetical protein